MKEIFYGNPFLAIKSEPGYQVINRSAKEYKIETHAHAH